MSTLDPAELGRLVRSIGSAEPESDPTVAIEIIRRLEELKGAVAAAQARQTVAYDEARRAAQRAAGVPDRELGRGVALELGLARRESPHRARQQLGWARILSTELPATLAALQSGQTSEWRAMIVARETGWLSREHRAEIDAAIAPRLGELGDKKVDGEVRRHAARLDPAGKVERLRRVRDERTVSVRPAPDSMVYLTALLPMTEGVSAYAALRGAAGSARATGDERSRGAIMADTLVERITGHAVAADVPLTVNLVMTDQCLLDAGPDRNEPAHLDGFGPVPAPIARDLVARAAARNGSDGSDAVPLWLRRLYVRPDTGQLVTMESRSRCFTDAQRLFVRLRDQLCRTPYCGSPITDADHARDAALGGPTALDNAQGLCRACNLAKQAPGITAQAQPDGSIHTTTPTGRVYVSHPVGLVNSRAPAPARAP